MFMTPVVNRCHDGKMPFRSKVIAKRAIRRMKGRQGKLEAYRCPVCNMFHVGHARRKSVI